MAFTFFSNPCVFFGPNTIRRLPELAKGYGNTLLLITGATSFQTSDHLPALLKGLGKKSISVHQAMVGTEPSPSMIDEIVSRYKGQNIDVVAAIGGGSALDAGKAVSAMMTKNESVIEYLEEVGTRSHDGKKLPFIALPTTAGTGSEATKNAVICQTGAKGFKKSLRHENFVPDIAIIDPELTLDCPPRITAACGMDALTQLLESLVSPQGSPMTDSLALGALGMLEDALITVATKNGHDMDARTKLSYAAYISGLTLANAGLGTVHGFASVIGGSFNMPHGMVCGTLVSETIRHTVDALISKDPTGPALHKYATAARLLNPAHGSEDPVKGARNLVNILARWTDELNMPGLGDYGITFKDIDPIVRATGQKNNPIHLSAKQLSHILQSRL